VTRLSPALQCARFFSRGPSVGGEASGRAPECRRAFRSGARGSCGRSGRAGQADFSTRGLENARQRGLLKLSNSPFGETRSRAEHVARHAVDAAEVAAVVTEMRRSCSLRPSVSCRSDLGSTDSPLGGKGFCPAPSLMGMRRSVMVCVAASGNAVHNSRFPRTAGVLAGKCPAQPRHRRRHAAHAARTTAAGEKWSRSACRPIRRTRFGGRVRGRQREVHNGCIRDSSWSCSTTSRKGTTQLYSPQPYVFVNWLEEDGKGRAASR